MIIIIIIIYCVCVGTTATGQITEAAKVLEKHNQIIIIIIIITNGHTVHCAVLRKVLISTC